MGLADKIKQDYEKAERAESLAARAGHTMGPFQADRLKTNHEAIMLIAEFLDETHNQPSPEPPRARY